MDTSPGAITRERLARAVYLHAEPLADGTWRVSGGAEPHAVNLAAGTCDCADFTVRGGPCKHVAACRLRSGDPETLEALRAVVPMPRRARRKGGL